MLVRRLFPLLAVLVAAGVVPTPAATAASSKCVALVVDATSLGGAVSSSCVTVPTNASGSDVLVRSGHRVTFDPRYGNDFVCAIDGRPAGGCHATNDTHYWVYYHRAPGSSAWHVSQEGAGTYRPANASTDGWVYDDGASSAPQPASVPYRSICRSAASPAPAPARTATPASPATGARASAPTPTRPPPTRPAATARTTPARPTRHVHASTSVSPTPKPASAAATAVPTAAPTRDPSPAAAPEPAPTKKSGFPVGLVAGLAAVVALGGVAAVRLRRGGA